MDIVLDFDGTITAKDTIACLGAFAVSRQQQSQQSQQQQHHYDDHGGHPTTTTTTEHHQDSTSTSTSTSRQATWDWIVSSYAADHARHAAAFEPAEADRRTVAAERAFLASLRAVDGASAARVARSRLFAGCTDAHLFEAGRDAVRAAAGAAAAAAFRPGFAAFLRDAAGNGGGGATVAVLSVNWSAAFIRGVVSMCDGPGGGRDGAAAVVSEVISNDIMADGSIGGPLVRGPEGEGGGGDRHAALTTSADKLRAFLDRRDSRGGSGARTTVYFGDSTTDLECLLEASAGVVMADEGGAEGSSALLRCLSRLGFHVPHVSEAAAAAAAAGLPPPRLAWARDFCEVMDSGHLAKLAAAGTASPAPREEEEGSVAEANARAASLER
ncbi:hypothetical protein RB601_007778 [Gaeumannomyces tritici]